MLYYLLYPLHESFGMFRVLRYISFRMFMAILTSLFIGFLIGPFFIRTFRSLQEKANNVREDVPESHQKKVGTPTMGGVMIIISLLGSFLLWGRFDYYVSWVAILSLLSFAFIGWFDDYTKITKKKGISSKLKMVMQVVATLLVVGVLLKNDFDRSLQVPFFKDLMVVLPVWAFVLFSFVTIIGTSNAVNITDGLDGLAIGPVMITCFTFLIFAYVASHEKIADYLQIIPISGAGELSVFCGAILGAGLGFLWFNTYPAQIFMGDVGSLSLGAAIGTIALIVKQELLLILVGGVFVLETVSVIIQVASFKMTGKRVFKMAPIHHHFELKGWAEPKIIVRFWIISIILALLALTTLKLR